MWMLPKQEQVSPVEQLPEANLQATGQGEGQ